ncbi:MAG TPA: urea ABC transporter permease subunit UrtC [Gemmataceae bacterium]|nr:urea ABC transporter permease subunit UrtC [Gemmataceae bacterium]
MTSARANPGPNPVASVSKQRVLGPPELVRAVLLVMFLASLFVPAYQFAGDRYWLPLFSKFMALAIFALSVDLIWGYTGLLSLGQGLYFGLGAYAAGYSLILQKAAIKAAEVTGTQPSFVPGPDMALPDFMEYCRVPAVPGWIAPLIDLRLALPLAILLPLLVATIFGWITFRLRVKGVYFALVTQALVLAAFTIVVNQQPYTAGVVGMRGLAKLQLFGHTFHLEDLYYLITSLLAVSYLGCLVLIQSKFGKVLTAIRDNENRVLALGYNTAMYKTFVFALAGALAGLAGVLYVASQGTAGPDRFGIEFSIEVVVMVAVGGRGTLYGAIIGAILVNLANTYINNEFENAWRFILGGLFVGVVLFLPNGIVGGGRSLVNWLWSWCTAWQSSRKALPEPEAAPVEFPAGTAAIVPPQPGPRKIQAATDAKGP